MKCRFDGGQDPWVRQRLAQGLKKAELDPSTRVWTTWESCSAAPLLTRTVDVGLACAYICGDAGSSINK